MTRHPTARRVHRAPTADDDKFVHGVLEGSVWAKQHGRTLIIAVIAVVAVVAIFLFVRSWNQGKETRAAAALNDLRATVSSGNVQLALRDGQTLLAQHGDTDAAAEARLLIAELHMQGGQPGEAAEVLAPLAGDMDAPLGFNAAMLLGAAHEAAGEPDRAVTAYEHVGRGAPYAYQQIAGYEAVARVRANGGALGEAASAYERILDLLDEDDPQRGVYEMRLAEMRAAAAAPAPAAAAPSPAAGDTVGS
jgi:predicted negative regulator of RcsB-dependent stress response